MSFPSEITVFCNEITENYLSTSKQILQMYISFFKQLITQQTLNKHITVTQDDKKQCIWKSNL